MPDSWRSPTNERITVTETTRAGAGVQFAKVIPAELQAKWALDAKRTAFAESLEQESPSLKKRLLAEWEALHGGQPDSRKSAKAALKKLVIEDVPLLTNRTSEHSTAPKSGLRPYSAWPRCTRWLAFEQTRNPYGAPVLGSWRFSSDWLLNCKTSNSHKAGWDHYTDMAFDAWLRKANVHDARTTRLPSDWDDIAFKIALNALDSDCRPFCKGCGRNIANLDLVLERGGGFKGDQVTRISCPQRHLLLDATTIHFD